MNKTVSNMFPGPGVIPVDLSTFRHDVMEKGLINDPRHPMFMTAPSRFSKTVHPAYSKTADFELAAKFSYMKNDIEIVTIPMSRFGLCVSFEGRRIIFVKSELPRVVRRFIIRWGLELLAKGDLVSFKDVFKEAQENAAPCSQKSVAEKQKTRRGRSIAP